VEAVAGDTRLGVDSVKADGTKPQPDDATGGSCLDLVMRGSSASTPGHTTPGNAVLAPPPRFPGVVDPRVAGPGLPGSPGLLPPPVN
jgi:hypothetical protein